MNPEAKQDRVDELFFQAAELPPDERALLLDAECNVDAELRSEVGKLLAAHDKSTAFLAPPENGEAMFGAADANDPFIGQRIGPYEIKKRLGSGGFGHVYMGFRSNDYKQKVAIKVLRSDVDLNERVLARFELERQLLADLQHEHIARLLYGGTLTNNRPYIVMEYVNGRPLTKYCDEKKLTVKARLALFKQVCQAVSYAHSYSVIHRDLKPGNILVTEEGKVKLLDFGIAKMIDPLSQRRMVTMSEGGMPMTPEYASPEQVRGHGISTASDVYSLGVVLYELLTGRRPYEFTRFTPAEVERVVCEVEPRKPSTVVLEPSHSRHDDGTVDVRSAETLADPRGTDPQKLHKTLKGDLEQIVLMALRKEPQRRYLTAEALVDDLDRFEEGLTIHARPVSQFHRAWRLAKRNPKGAALLLTTAVALLFLLTGSIVFAVQQKHLANARTVLAEDKEAARLDAETKLHQALLDRASGLRMMRAPGYREEVWKSLRLAASLNIPEKQVGAIRDEVLACLGDPIGLSPVRSPSVERSPSNSVPDHFQSIIRKVNATKFALSSDGRWLAIPREGRTVQVIIYAIDGTVTAKSEVPLSSVYDLKFTDDNQTLVAGCDHGIVVWTLPTLEYRAVSHGETVLELATHPHGKLLATMGGGSRIEVTSLLSNRPLTSFIAPAEVQHIEFSADGQLLLGVSYDRKEIIIGWFVGDTPEKKYLIGHNSAVTGTVFSPADGATLASASKDGTARIWNSDSGTLRHVCHGHSAEVSVMDISQNGELLGTGDRDGEIRVWDLATGLSLAVAQHCGTIWRLKFDSSGRYLISAGQGGAVCWEVSRTDDHVVLTAFSGAICPRIYDLAIHPNSLSYVFTDSHELGYWGNGYSRPRPYLVELTDADNVKQLPLPLASGFDQIKFERTGDRLWFTTSEKSIATWDLTAGRVVRETPQRFSPSSGAHQLTADDRWAAIIGPSGKQITMYDRQQNRPLFVLPPEPLPIWNFGWSPDGTRLVIGRPDGIIAIWNLKEIRDRLSEFGIRVPSTAVQSKDLHDTAKLTQQQFEEIKAIQRPNLLRFQAFQNSARLLQEAKTEFRQQQPENGIKQIEDLLELHKNLVAEFPDAPMYRRGLAEVTNTLSWILVTSSENDVLDTRRALDLAYEACKLTEFKIPYIVGTLAAAYAETGDFHSAVKWSEKALELLGEDGDPEQRKAMLDALELYKAKKPMRQTSVHTDEQSPPDEQSPKETAPATPPINTAPSDIPC